MMRVFQLAIAGDVVALRIGFVIGGSLYLYYSGFDPRWSKYSVMTTTVVEAVKYAIGQGLTAINLSPIQRCLEDTLGIRAMIALNQAVQISPSLLSRFGLGGV